MSKVYTRTGDKGTTGLFTGQRVSKGSLRVETYGTVDEADSVLGMARAFAVHEEVKEAVFSVQKALWQLMADVASMGKEPRITDTDITAMEHAIDTFDAKLEPLNHFIVPGESKSSSFLDLARAVVRRAERNFWRLGETEDIHEVDVRYLNRLSDFCFILSRYESEVQ